MPNRPKKRWLDVQVILASLAVTFSVGLWNAFAKANRPIAGAPITPDTKLTFTYTPNPTATATLNASAPVHLPKIHLLLGGNKPVLPVVVADLPAGADPGIQASPQNSAPQTASPAPAPAPVTNTGSSKP